MDVIYQGEDWSREVIVTDAAEDPVVATDLAAALTTPRTWPYRWYDAIPPEPVDLTVEAGVEPGTYLLSLDAAATADLAAPCQRTWDLSGVVNGQRKVLSRAQVRVIQTSSRAPTP